MPTHVQQWAEELQHKASVPNSATGASLEHYNEIEAEVIVGGHRCSGGNDEDSKFGRHKFKDVKAYRVACLLASARLISTLSSPSFLPPTPFTTPRCMAGHPMQTMSMSIYLCKTSYVGSCWVDGSAISTRVAVVSTQRAWAASR
eukprot:1974809-Rhodomonas_salina.2